MKHNFLQKIEVQSLWNLCDLVWELTPEVNILGGTNGSGKSTLLRCLAELFREGTLSGETRCRFGELIVTLSDGTRIHSGDTFDPTRHPLTIVEVPDTLPLMLPPGNSDARTEQFYHLIDTLFASSAKRIDRSSRELRFQLGNSGIVLTPEALSSGEQKALTIFTTLLALPEQQPVTLLLDEPEVSLHFDWQRRLIDELLALHPQLQLIIATHSPAVVMDGWVAHVSEIKDLIRPLGTVQR